MAHQRVAVFDTANGARIRYLTASYATQHQGGARLADVVGAGAPARAWFLVPTGPGPCLLGAYSGYSVAINGGRPRREFGGDRGRSIGAIAADRETGTFVTVATTCPAHQTQHAIVFHRRHAPVARVEMPLNAGVGGLNLGGDKLSFFVSADSDGNARLYVLNGDALSPGVHSLDAAVEAPDPGPGCHWQAATWSRAGLVAARQCMTHLDNMGPTTVFLLDPQTLRVVRRGPTVAHGLGIVGLSSDDRGHLIVWHGPGGFVGGITSWTSAGRHVITTGGACADDEVPAGNSRCPSYPMW